MGGCLRSKGLDHRSGTQALDWVGSLIMDGCLQLKGLDHRSGPQAFEAVFPVNGSGALLTVDWVGSLIMSDEPCWPLNGSGSPFRGSGSLNGLDHCKGI